MYPQIYSYDIIIYKGDILQYILTILKQMYPEQMTIA